MPHNTILIRYHTTQYDTNTISYDDRYIEAIERMLKPGGVWVNLGPLLYHWAAAADSQEDQEVGADPRYAQSVEVRLLLCL